MTAESKILLLHDLSRRPDGMYDSTPSHITVIPPFKTNSVETIYNLLKEEVQDFKPFIIKPGAIECYGENNDIPVITVDDVENGFGNLHTMSMSCLMFQLKVGFRVKQNRFDVSLFIVSRLLKYIPFLSRICRYPKVCRLSSVG